MAGKDVYVNFGADVGGLEAGVARAQAEMRAAQREMTRLAVEMQRTGATVDSELGQKLAGAGSRMADARSSVAGLREQLAAIIKPATEAAEATGHLAGEGGKGLNAAQMAESVHVVKALFDEIAAGQSPMRAIMMEGGRIGQILAGGISPAVMQWAAMGAGVLATAGALGYAAIQALAFKDAAENIRNVGLISQFEMTTKAAGDVVTAISHAANVSYAEAAKIAQPFLELGPGGEKLAEIASFYVPMFVKAMGVDAPKAAEALAKKFADLKGEGAKYVSDTVEMSSATKRLYEEFLRAGETGKAWDIVLQALKVRLEGGRQALAEEAAATLDFSNAVQAAASAESGFDISQQLLAEQAERTTRSLEAQRVAMAKATTEAGTEAARSRVIANQKAEAADKIVEGVNKESAEVRKLQAEYDQVVERLKSIDQSSAAGYQAAKENWAAQKRLQNEIAEAQEKANGGAIPETAFDRAQQQIKELESSWKGSRAALLEQEQAILRLQQTGNNVPGDSREGRQFANELANKRKEAIDAESASFSRGEDIKTAKAADQTAARLAQARSEAAEKARLYGAGSDPAAQAAVTVAQAERAAAEQRRAERAAEIDREVADQRRATQEKLRDIADDVRNKRASSQQGLADSTAALRNEETAVRALYEEKKRLALTSAQDARAINKAEADLSREVATQIRQQQRQAADAMAQSYRAVADQIADIMDSQVDGLLRGTVSVKEAIANMAAQAIEDLIKLGLRIAAETAAMSILRLVTGGTVGGGGGGGFFGLPIPGFADGTPYVSNTGLALIHEGEAIIPAAANPFGAGASAAPAGGSGGGGDTHNHVWNISSNAQDPRQVAREVAHVWDRNPSLRPKY